MNKLIFAFTMAVVCSSASNARPAAPTNLVPNPGFEQGLDGWATSGKGEFAADSQVKHGGGRSARITVPPDANLEFQQIAWSMPAKPGEHYSASFWLRTEGLKDGAGAYGAIEFFRGGDRLVYFQSQMTRTLSWQPMPIEAVAPGGTDRMRVVLICHAHGTAWFDDVTISRPQPQPLNVSFALQPRKLITDDWQGFGCQADLFLDMRWTASDGITDADRALIRDRIKEMRPQIVRLMFQTKEWEPERGKQMKDSDIMRDLRNTIAIYKSVGADVMLTEWGFGFPTWMNSNGRVPGPDRRQEMTDSLVAAVKYLRDDCGLDNIRYVNVWNEPNYGGITWEDYAACCRCLDKSLKNAGLREVVAILGPDETSDLDWTVKSAAELDDVIDCYDVHNYTSNTGVHFASWVAPRIEAMPKVKASRRQPPRKRLMITEFGMQEGMSTFESKRNGDYDYGVFLADCAIEAAKAGASALMSWCLMDTNYGSSRMKWGLWRYKDQNWEPRPGFYAWSLITRYTERGSTIHSITSDVTDAAAVAFRAPKSGPWTLLVVNRRSEQRPFELTGLPASSRWELFVYSVQTAPTPDRHMIRSSGVESAGPDGRLHGTLPARSFLLWRQVRG